MAAGEKYHHLIGNPQPLLLRSLNLFRAEEVGGGDFPQRRPVNAVGGEAHGAVEHQVVSGFVGGAVGEGGGVENLLGDVGVAGEEGSCLTEREGHEALGVAGGGDGREFPVG